MPFDFVFTSPPFSGVGLRATPSGALPRYWLDHVASLIEALSPTHVFIENSGLLFALPHRLPAIVARQVVVRDRDEPYPEAFVFGSPAAYAAVVWRDNLDAGGATIRMRVHGRVAPMIVAPRQGDKRFL